MLSGWNGKEGYTFDRIGRGTVHIPAVDISIIGTTQPSRLARYIRDSLKNFDDGMVQRLQLFAWPDFSGEFREVDRFPDSDARQLANERYSDLASLDARELGTEWDKFAAPDAVPYLRFADDAQELFIDWRGRLERKKLGCEETAPALIAHLAKYRGLIPRLALICHLAGNARGPVTLKACEQAIAWADYLESHARRAYGSLSFHNSHAARAIWRRVCKSDLPSPFTARDIRQKGWSGLTDQKRIEAGLSALVDAAHIAPQRVTTGGRPSYQYRANPKAIG